MYLWLMNIDMMRKGKSNKIHILKARFRALTMEAKKKKKKKNQQHYGNDCC